MKIFTEINEQKNLSLALGFFDGIHKGHAKVIENAVKIAQIEGIKSAVITFKDHPKCFFNPIEPKYILTREERRKKIATFGIDYMYELDFTKFAKLNAADYLENILIKNFSPKAISTGFNHNFGINKSGNTDLLLNMSEKYNYKYYMLPAQTEKEEIISSTKIRDLLTSGEIEKANKMLGYNFSISGEIIYGQQLGRQLGYKTANMQNPEELIILPYGVYKTIVKLDNNIYKGITNYGSRPTIQKNNTLSVETHLLDFDEDIYGKNIRVEFLNKIRDEKKFSNLDELKLQIKQDLLCAK